LAPDGASTGSDRLLEVRDLVVAYDTHGGAPVVAVDGIGFDVHAGEAVGIAGESGSGKTTVALALLGLLPPGARVVQGSARFRGQDLFTLSEASLESVRGAEISIIFQEPGLALNPVLRVGSQVAEVLRAHRSWSARRCREEAGGLLSRVGLPASDRLFDAYPHELSYGQRQRVTIAQAVACDPALLVADEPTSSLDSTTRADILGLLGELKAGMGLALLLVSHDIGTLAALADRLLVVYAGRVVEEGRLERVCRDPLHPYTRALLGSLPRPRAPGEGRRLESLEGSPPDPAHLPPGCAFEPRCPDRMERCLTRRPDAVEPQPGRRVRCFKHDG
jgi:oligopeptide/dipeptide ABC transporter ATP-binding protein